MPPNDLNQPRPGPHKHPKTHQLAAEGVSCIAVLGGVTRCRCIYTLLFGEHSSAATPGWPIGTKHNVDGLTPQARLSAARSWLSPSTLQ